MRNHPVGRLHKALNVQQYHNKSLTKNESKYRQGKCVKSKAKSKVEKPLYKRQVLCLIDNDNYLNIDIDKVQNAKGVRLKFTRIEGRKKKEIGLQIDKRI